MKKSLLFLALLLACAAFMLQSNHGKTETYHPSAPPALLFSANPPAGRTGAPGESNCTVSCHGGSTQSAAGIIDVSFSGAGNEYIVDQHYTFTISTATGSKNGFEATILDAANTKAGTFTAGTNYSLANLSGRQYVRHNVSTGITSWTFDWTAPLTDMGDLTLYYAFNKSNASGTSSGDVIYLGQFNITSAAFNTVTEYERTDEKIQLWYDSQNQSLKMDYQLFNPATVILSVQDLAGKLILQQNLGAFEKGHYTDAFQLPEKPNRGIYIVSLFIDNAVYNRKIFIG